MERKERTYFYIKQRPVAISFTCPYCDEDVEIPWKEMDVPEYWGDDWGPVECPECGEEVELGDYELD